MTTLYLFGSTFALVFFLGMQSLAVNGGHRWLAPNADGLEIVAYLSGGPLGIVSAMAVFGRWKQRDP